MHPNDGRVVSNFIVQALTGEASRSTATARSHAVLHVDDLSEGYLRFSYANSREKLTQAIEIMRECFATL